MRVGPGLSLVVLGALLTFAIDDHMEHVRLPVAGIILMLAGVLVMWHSHRTAQSEKVVTVTDSSSDPSEPSHVHEETVREHRTD
jgi:uncharacterized membrane protein YqjE